VIKISVLYPNQDGGRFDMDYYCQRHIPMVIEKLGTVCKGVSVLQGLSGMTPGTPAPFCVLADLLFESVEAFQSAFAPHAPEIMADIPQYTTIQPIIQINEVKI
jgi:uncharacterized protein (TIGR02118 family)